MILITGMMFLTRQSVCGFTSAFECTNIVHDHFAHKAIDGFWYNS